jgi:hypothetical protein
VTHHPSRQVRPRCARAAHHDQGCHQARATAPWEVGQPRNPSENRYVRPLTDRRVNHACGPPPGRRVYLAINGVIRKARNRARPAMSGLAPDASHNTISVRDDGSMVRWAVIARNQFPAPLSPFSEWRVIHSESADMSQLVFICRWSTDWRARPPIGARRLNHGIPSLWRQSGIGSFY